MSTTLHLKVETGLMAKSIETIMGTQAIAVVTTAAMQVLSRELGGHKIATRWLTDLAEQYQKPVALNVETSKTTSTTVFIPPRGWSEERLQGYVAGMHEELEREFGDIGSVRRFT